MAIRAPDGANNEGIIFFCNWEVTIIKVLPAPTYLEDVELQMD